LIGTTSRRSSGGLTLIELTMVVALATTLLVTLLSIEGFISSGSEQLFESSRVHAAAMSTLSEIEQSIRLADEVEATGTSILTLKTRFGWDTDAAWEKVRYTLQGGVLYREIAQGAAPYGAPEIALDGVSSFQTHALELTDSFTEEHYSDASETTLGDKPALTGLLSHYNSLTELSVLDATVQTSVDLSQERLELTASSVSSSVTFTPPLKKQGLFLKTSFTANTGRSKYRPLIFGAGIGTIDAVLVAFDSDGRVRLQSFENGELLGGSTFSASWAERESYAIELSFDDGMATARLFEPGGTVEEVNPIPTGDLTEGAVSAATDTYGATGFWDNLVVRYPFVEVEIEYTASGQTRSIFGGAARRQP